MPSSQKVILGMSEFLCILYLMAFTHLSVKKPNNFERQPSGKNFENAPKFKSSPQNNDISVALLKQMLCGTSMYNKYLANFNLKIYIAKQESRGRNLNFGEI
jgi:hypothetical protein